MKKFKKLDPKLLLVFLVGVVLSLALVIFISNRLGITSPTQVDVELQQQEPDLSLVLSKLPTGNMKVGITPKGEKNISSFSIRFTADYDSNLSRPSSFTPNAKLFSSNWLFPINIVSVDEIRREVTIDISGVNTSLDGFNVSTPIDIGTINFSEGQENSSLTLSLDKSETKILAKDASELNYEFINQ